MAWAGILRAVVVNVGVHMSPSLVANALIIAVPVDAAEAVVWAVIMFATPVPSHQGW
jgi:hypothetical protein